MFTSFPPPQLIGTDIVSTYVYPAMPNNSIEFDGLTVTYDPQNTVRMKCSLENAIVSSRIALISAGYNVLQLGHYRLLACKNVGTGRAFIFDLSFCNIGRENTEIVFTQR